LNLLQCALFAFKDTSLIFGCLLLIIVVGVMHRLLKAHGKSAKESYLLNGYALNTGRAAQGMLKHVPPARIA
jgi:hypothetical protein